MSEPTPVCPEVDIQPLLLRCKTCAAQGPEASEAKLIPGHIEVTSFLFGQVHKGHDMEIEAITTAPASLAGRTVRIPVNT